MAVLVSPAARADFMDGNSLYESCKKSNDAFCEGYIAGISDAMLPDNIMVSKFVAGNVDIQNPAAGCLRPNITLRQIKDVVLQHLQKDPASRDLSAAPLVAFALGESFPCIGDALKAQPSIGVQK
jgi:Ssp1 endopeptidase immunity protein Rap1a